MRASRSRSQTSSVGALEYRSQRTFPLVINLLINPADPDRLLTGSPHLMKSTGSGRSWQRVSHDLRCDDPATTGDPGGSISRDHPSIQHDPHVFAIARWTVNENVIWVGADDGRARITNHGGAA